DGYSDDDEVAAGSDPFNPNSILGTTTLSLNKGFNLVSFPAETGYYGNMFNLMEVLGSSNVISKILIFDPNSQIFNEVGYKETGQFYGQNLSLTSGQVGLIIYAKQDATFTFTSKYCSTWNLKTGTNLVGTPCAPTDMTAFQLLKAIGDETVVSSIQRFNTDTGMFETAGYLNGQIVGVDFSMKAGEGYFIYMKKEVLGFKP
ncbi:MAG: thrombospondin type 3 repeat-containing protein, partial [Nitrospirota bacterium]